MISLLTHYECSACGREHASDALQGVCCGCGRPLLARYDLAAARRQLARDSLAGRPPNLWRYGELLPIRDERAIVSLGEGMSPLLPAPRIAAELGLRHLWVKDEGQLPTGTFKARGLAVAVSLARQNGVTSLAMPSAGNAAGALAAYAARAGMRAVIAMPEDAPAINQIECQAAGATLLLVRGLITDAGKMIATAKERYGWFDVSTLKEPGRIEGKKTMGYELAEQFEWELPDVILYPTGGGTGLIGMWKAFAEMGELGWIERRPRLIAVQAAGCAPIVRAFEAGQEEAAPFAGASTLAAGIRVPKALGDFLILRALRQSGGTAVAVSDAEIVAAVRTLYQREGIFAAPEGAATLAGLAQLVARGSIRPDERVVLFNTGSGLKYPDVLPARAPVLDAGTELGPELFR